MNLEEYKAIEDAYIVAGWSPVPFWLRVDRESGKVDKAFPARTDTHPGVIGYHGALITAQNKDVLITDADRHQADGIAIRPSRDVIGVDVDQYERRGKLKQGWDNVQRYAAEHNLRPWPKTWRSSARGRTSKSGIYWFRVPLLPEGRKFADPKDIGDVELIAFHLRPGTVWPSLHADTGDRYEWFDPFGECTTEKRPTPGDLDPTLVDALVAQTMAQYPGCTEPLARLVAEGQAGTHPPLPRLLPRAEELPELPPEWVEVFTQEAAPPNPEAGTIEALVRADQAEPCRWMKRIVLEADEALDAAEAAGSRHYPAARDAVGELFAAWAHGHVGAGQAVDVLAGMWEERHGSAPESDLDRLIRDTAKITGERAADGDPCTQQETTLRAFLTGPHGQTGPYGIPRPTPPGRTDDQAEVSR